MNTEINTTISTADEKPSAPLTQEKSAPVTVSTAKTATKKTVAKKPASKKTPVKNVAKKATAKKTIAKKVTVRKTSIAKSSVPQKTEAEKTKTTPTKAKTTPVKVEVPAQKVKVKKQKMVRDSFTMPELEYETLGTLKKACLKQGIAIKKSELLRIGVAALKGMTSKQIETARNKLEKISAGRPKKD